VITIIAVEPNALLRLGIQQLFQECSTEVSCDGVDYAQLFNGGTATTPTDLMLLSAPDTYEQTAELIQAGQKAYNPGRILLLFEPAHPPFTLRSLSPRLVGYVSKRAPTAMLTAAINLVLAGGRCFPNPDTPQRQEVPPPSSDAAQHRRWYEQEQPLPNPHTSPTRTDEVPSPIHPPIRTLPGPSAVAKPSAPAPLPARASVRSSPAGTPDGVPPRDLITSESRILNLTSRQYEVLVLLAHGYPIKTISRELNISISTAKTHADTLYQRLSVHNSLAAVYEALTRGATLGLSQKPLAQLGSPAP
jgi:DNA-binding NarL/FixJ family response regulator